MINWFVYILFCDQKTFYVGMTNNLRKRLLQHEKGESNYTKKFSDIKLVHSEIFKTRKEAENREKQLKGWSVAKKKALISNNKDSLIKLSKGTEVAKV